MSYSEMAKEFYKTFTSACSGQLTKQLDVGTSGMYCILRILRNSNGELLSVDIAKAMDVSTARVAVAMKALAKRGYIEKIPTAYDGRKVVVKITQSGLNALTERETMIYNLIETLLKKLNVEEAQTFIALSKKIFG